MIVLLLIQASTFRSIQQRGDDTPLIPDERCRGLPLRPLSVLYCCRQRPKKVVSRTCPSGGRKTGDRNPRRSMQSNSL